MGDAGANRGERDRPQLALAGKLEAPPGRVSQAFHGRAAAKGHARGVDDEAGFELAARSDGGATHLDRPDGATLRLDRRAATPGNGSGHTPAEDQVAVRRVDDGVDILLGQVALEDVDRQAARSPAHPVGWTCQAIDAIRASTSQRVIACSPRTLKSLKMRVASSDSCPRPCRSQPYDLY